MPGDGAQASVGERKRRNPPPPPTHVLQKQNTTGLKSVPTQLLEGAPSPSLDGHY